MQIIDGREVATTFAYGDFGQLASVTDPKGNTVSIEYDQRGRRRVVAGSRRGHAGAPLQRVRRSRARDCQRIARTARFATGYDILGRLTAIDSPLDGSTTQTWDTAPNGVGRLAHTSAPDGTEQDFAYDAVGPRSNAELEGRRRVLRRSTTATTGWGGCRRSLIRTSSAAGVPRFTVARSYTASNYLREVARMPAARGGTRYWYADSRNADDRLTHATLGNGL